MFLCYTNMQEAIGLRELIGLFLPAFFAVLLLLKDNNYKCSKLKLFITYINYVLFLNIFGFLSAIYIFKEPNFTFTNIFTVKYLCLECILALLMVIITKYWHKNIKIKFFSEAKIIGPKSRKQRAKNVFANIIIILSIIIFLGTLYYKKNYHGQTFEVLIFNVFGGIKDSNLGIIWDILKELILPFIITFIIVYIPVYNKTKNNYYLNLKLKNETKKIQIYPTKRLSNHKFLYAIVLLIISVGLFFYEIGTVDYLANQTTTSDIFENNYVPGNEVQLTFPQKKRNLILLFLESTESSLASKANGGGWKYSIVPELEQLAIENINFSNNDKVGGALPAYGTGWTTAGMLAQTSGIPLKINIGKNNYKGYKFLPGIYSMGDIFKDKGYNQELMLGSDSNFGGLKDYFTTHGKYKIFDVNEAIKLGKMQNKDRVWWGFSDDDLFKWSKEEILKLAKQDKPFNFTMITADTHFPDGYLSKNVGHKFKSQYENVYAYSSKSVYNFITWIQEQDFYKDTTIVIVGDHLGMQDEFYEKNLPKDYQRTVYNTFINSLTEPTQSKNRKFATMDIFPSILSSMGIKIEGNRIGLGTNLFSNKNTLIEEMGYDKYNKELSKKSEYYNYNLLKDDYIKLLNKEKADKEKTNNSK